MQDAQPGALDESLPRVLPIMEAQLFGEVAEEKEAGVFAGTREAKKLRAYDTYQLLAQAITFRTQLATLLAPVSPCISSHDASHLSIQCVPSKAM